MPGIDECLLEAMRLPGARCAAVVDWISGLSLGVAGEPPGGDHEAAACETAELARMVAEYRSLGPLSTLGTPGDPAAPAPGTPPQAPHAPRAGSPGSGPSPGPGDPDATSGHLSPPVPPGTPDLSDSAAHRGGAVPAVEDIIATNSDSYHLLRFVTGALDGTLFLHLWLARDEGNLALARIRLAEIAGRMVL
ncbi:hypothetical protein [Streptomyces qinglanensis]|uniref:Roadblock/LAMTOR2 domain-containing protein n=1 Tax=Streptomyces qinglanensis TaxID=943816 RepID=A0A1H9WGL0_9ACTN|nr:hypothetical protein SAMN05421870_117151 [Streptomyces qinglanensis]